MFLNVPKCPECKNAVRAHAVVGHYSVSDGPLEGPGDQMAHQSVP